VACPTGNASRAGMDFYKETGIKTSDHKDYEANEWDKGHMAPAAHFNCTREMLLETFTYMNCALQHQSLNRGVWKHLEARERELANKHNVVEVTIRVQFDKNPPRVPAGAAIPKGFYKEIKYGNTRECYYFPNTTPSMKTYNDYKCNCR
jgi:DNA/RNA endonuclease G (NUC1)